MNKRIIFTLLILMSMTLYSASAWPFGKNTKDQRKKDRVTSNQKAEKKGTKSTEPKDPAWYQSEPKTREDKIYQILSDDDIVDSITPEDNLKLSLDQLSTVWEKNMHDFVAQDMISFLVLHGSAEEFNEFICHKTPKLIKGAYYVHGSADALPLSAMIVQDPLG